MKTTSMKVTVQRQTQTRMKKRTTIGVMLAVMTRAMVP